jgi:hypothetical protein
MSVPYTRTTSSLTVITNFRSTVIPSSHPNFATLCEMVTKVNTTEADILPLLDIPTAITNFTGDEIKVVGGKLYYRGVEVKDNLAQVILGFVKSGDLSAALPFQKFLANCRNNPDLELVSTIYDWCVKGNLPITPDGHLIAWKIVGPNFKSLHSGKRGYLDHSIGAVVTEPREECDTNRNRTCSTGIHFASLEYIEKGGYGGGLDGRNKIVAVTIDPADITAIPTDYNLSKGRCCRLTVVGEVPAPKVKSFYDNAGRVYSGWSAQPVAPAPKNTRFPVQQGDVWLTSQGERVIVARIASAGHSGEYATLSNGQCVYTENGSLYLGGNGPNDLVELISEGKRTPRNAAGFAVGQVWAVRNGDRITISSITGSGSYPVQAGSNRYTAQGRFNSDTSVSQFDLVRLITDVA